MYLALNKNRLLFFLNLFIRISTIAAFIWAATVGFDTIVYMALITISAPYLITTTISVYLVEMNHFKFIVSHIKPVLVVSLACATLLAVQKYADLNNLLLGGLIYSVVYAISLYLAKDSAVQYLRNNIIKRTA